MKIAISILKSKYDELETIQKINKTSADFIHLDVADGTFVETVTPKREFLSHSDKKMQVHLMVSHPEDYFDEYSVPFVESITFPVEIEENISLLLENIKSRGLKCGLALNPETEVSAISQYLDILDNVIVMSVVPGKGGQKMITDVLYKIGELKELREKRNLDFQITVDGGVNAETIDFVREADIVVSGSYICMSEDYQTAIDNLDIS